VLHAAGCKYSTQKSPKIRNLRTIGQLCRAISSQLRHILTIGKKLLSSNISCTCPHNMSNIGPLTTEIGSLVSGTPANFSWFHVLAALLHGTLVWASAKLCGVEQRAPPIFGRAAITLDIGSHSSSFFFCPRLMYAVADWMSATWCGLSANLECRSEMFCTRLAGNAGHKKWKKIRRLGTIVQLCRAISSQLRHVSTIGKKTCQQYLSTCSYNMVNFGLLAAEIVSLVWGTAANFNGFRVLASWPRY